jgi:hypothetical protein
MKALKTLLLAGALLALLVLPASFAADQYGTDNTVSPSNFKRSNWLTNHNTTNATSPFLIPGITTTNIPGNQANILPIPVEGFGFFMRTGGTNASDTTNLTITLEVVMFPTGSKAGGTQVVDNAVISVVTPTTVSTLPTGYDYLTNFSGFLVTGTALVRGDGVRIRSIQNTNLNSLWISNLIQLR